MAYTHLTMNEIAWIETYYLQGVKPVEIARRLSRSNQPIYNVVNKLKDGWTAQDYMDQYKANKQRCGRKKKILTSEAIAYIRDKVSEGWTPDTIIGRQEKNLGVSVKTLYRRFKDDSRLSAKTLPMKGKRKPNGYQEKRGHYVIIWY